MAMTDAERARNDEGASPGRSMPDEFWTTDSVPNDECREFYVAIEQEGRKFFRLDPGAAAAKAAEREAEYEKRGGLNLLKRKEYELSRSASYAPIPCSIRR